MNVEIDSSPCATQHTPYWRLGLLAACSLTLLMGVVVGMIVLS